MHRGLNHVLDTTLRILPTGIHLDSQLPCAVDTHSPPFYTWEKLTICPQQGDGQVWIGTWWRKFLETNKQGPVPKGGAKPWPGMREWAPKQEDCGRAMYPKGHQVQGCLKLPAWRGPIPRAKGQGGQRLKEEVPKRHSSPGQLHRDVMGGDLALIIVKFQESWPEQPQGTPERGDCLAQATRS